MNFAYKWLLNKPYENEVNLTGQNLPIKCSQHLETYTTLKNRLISLNAEKLGSLGQRAAKLLAVKVGVLKKKSAALVIPA